MSDKTELLSQILGSLSEDDKTTLEKVATDAGSNKNTENSEAAKKIPSEGPSKTEKKLGLSVLSQNKHEDDIKTFDGVAANKKDGQGTEDINVKKPSVEPGLTFEKKASAEVIDSIYEAAGVDLSKIASTEAHEDLLLKVAEDTLNEMQDLEKVAQDLAEATADKFMAIIESKI